MGFIRILCFPCFEFSYLRLKREKHRWRSVIFNNVAGLLSDAPPWLFFTFLNFTNDTKSGKASQLSAEPKRLVDCRYTSSFCKMFLSRNQSLLKFYYFFKRLCQVSGRNNSFVNISPTGHISLKTAKLVSLLQMLTSGFQ